MQNQQITLIVPGESPYITPNSAHIIITDTHVQQILNTS